MDCVCEHEALIDDAFGEMMGGNSLHKLRWIWFRFDKEGTKGFTGKKKMIGLKKGKGKKMVKCMSSFVVPLGGHGNAQDGTATQKWGACFGYWVFLAFNILPFHTLSKLHHVWQIAHYFEFLFYLVIL